MNGWIDDSGSASTAALSVNRSATDGSILAELIFSLPTGSFLAVFVAIWVQMFVNTPTVQELFLVREPYTQQPLN